MAGQVRAAIEGAGIAKSMIEGMSPALARQQIAEVERAGDSRRSELVVGLSRTLITPLDREDLFRLSRSIDDALDTLRDFVREADLYGLDDRRRYLLLVEATIDALSHLEQAVATLWTAPAEVPERALAAKKAARQVTRAYREEFARTVMAGTGTLKHRELIKRLDWVGIRISEAADVLTDGALKRGY